MHAKLILSCNNSQQRKLWIAYRIDSEMCSDALRRSRRRARTVRTGSVRCLDAPTDVVTSRSPPSLVWTRLCSVQHTASSTTARDASAPAKSGSMRRAASTGENSLVLNTSPRTWSVISCKLCKRVKYFSSLMSPWGGRGANLCFVAFSRLPAIRGYCIVWCARLLPSFDWYTHKSRV